MIKEAQNKKITTQRTKDVSEETFFFSDYQISITASSYEEALQKLNVILNDRAK